MTLSKDEKKATLAVSRRRYAEIKGKKKRGQYLDEFCATTGLSRKHAIFALSHKAPKDTRRRGPPKKHSMNAANLVAKAWKLAGKPCGKLLRPVIRDYIASLRRHEAVDEAAAKEVLTMSASTLDRRLRSLKPRAGHGPRRHDSLTEHRRAIGLKIDVWPADAKQKPGWLEVDTVAHCGGSMLDNFFWTLTTCDVATQWTQMYPAWNKGAHTICAALKEAFAATPVPVLGANTDNGPEFLNEHLARAFPELCPGAVRSRSRPYVKNDNPHVEQKNGHAVRRILGYGRLDREEAFELLRELLTSESLFRNLYCATFKLVSKRREGARWVKVFEKEPKTPAQRMLESAAVSEASKARVRALLAANDPVRLRCRADQAACALVRFQAAPPSSPVRRSDELLTAHSRPGREKTEAITQNKRLVRE